MEQSHPVLRHLAVRMAARDFGLPPDELDALAQRFPPQDGRVEEFAAAAGESLLNAR